MAYGNGEMNVNCKHIYVDNKKLRLHHLVKVICFGTNLHQQSFFDRHGEVFVDESFGNRWLMFASLAVQKVLTSVACLMKCIGSTVEKMLNLETNYGVIMLIRSLLQGNELEVDPASPKYVSIIGHLDKRVELDYNIQRGDPRYNAALSIMASKVSYENKAFVRAIVEDHWQMELVANDDYWNEFQTKATTQAFILLDKSGDQETYVVAFRGTEPFDANAWCTDVDFSWLEIEDVGKIHVGFMKALGLQKEEREASGSQEKERVMCWPKEIENNESHPPPAYYAIRDILKNRLVGNDKAKFIVTGHSLGGALAILFPAILMLHDETMLLERLEAVYTFGQPRVGDEYFANYMEEKLKYNCIEYYRYTYCNDIVPRLPFDVKDLLFKHFGTCLYYDRNYKGKVGQEEPNKNYFFNSLAQILMMVNAFCELIRSFTIASKYGPEYKEGWLLRLVRFVGLAFPGLPNHVPQDYVNATRLGSTEIFIDGPKY